MLKFNHETVATGRNDVCPCGSGKKFKKCCALTHATPTPIAPPRNRAAEVASRWQSTVRAFESGDLTRAQIDCDEVLRLDARHAEALHVRGLIAHLQKQPQAALVYVRRALKLAPRTALFHNSLGIILNVLKQFPEAETAFRAAVQFDPACAQAMFNLGELLETKGQRDHARQWYEKALRQQPQFPEALNNLGSLLTSSGQFAEAAQHLSAALALRPDYAKAHFHLARALRGLKRTDEAVAALREAVRHDPALSLAWHVLGILLKQTGQFAESWTAFERAIQLDPEIPEGYFNLGKLAYELGLGEQSRTWFERGYQVRPSDGFKLCQLLSLPGFFESQEQSEALLARLTVELDQLMTADLHIDDPLDEVGLTPFYLAYQGQNVAPLLSRIGDLFRQACPALGYTAPHCTGQLPEVRGRRIELGFISSYFGADHIVNRSVSGVIAKLPRDRFRVTILHLNGPCNEILLALKAGDRLVKVPAALADARARIAAEQLDILFYTDLGLEPWTYFLSFARLAHVQCTSGGHPVTSGVENIDYYISSTMDETPEAQAHYRERLVALPNRPVSFHAADQPESLKTRADFGLSTERRLYLCPMTPFKLQPANDELFAKLLRADPAGELVFILNYQTELWQRLQARFARTMPEVAARVRYLPYQTMPDFVALLQLADVILDTPAFNGGTTSFEALAVGTPMVTLPGTFYRQRTTYGLYKWMELFDCVARDADDYVRLALEIAQQPERRAALKQKILARKHVLFGAEAGILELGQFLCSVFEGEH